jgi:hypothetical protein
MSNLFELTEEYMQLLEMAEDPDIDPEVLADTMEGLTGEIEDKADGYAYVIDSINADVDMIDKEIKRLQARKKVLTGNADRIKQHLRACMEAIGMRKIKTAKHTFTIAKNGGKIPVVVTDDWELYDVDVDLVDVKKTLNLDATRAYLENGGYLPFAELGERGESLRIK